MDLKIGNEWDELLDTETDKPYFVGIMNFLENEYREHAVYPPRSLIFASLKYVSYSDAKVVIVGQDPYINPGQANGLAFAVGEGIALPPSLRNIYKEIETDLGVSMAGKGGELTGWAKQGVLLLNATLTVRAGSSNTHAKCGWQEFTDFIIKTLGLREKPLAFILWGRNAQMKEPFIGKQHYIIKSAHPSPMSATSGFFGSRPFSRVNKFLASYGCAPVDWADVTAYNAPSYYKGAGRIIRG